MFYYIFLSKKIIFLVELIGGNFLKIFIYVLQQINFQTKLHQIQFNHSYKYREILKNNNLKQEKLGKLCNHPHKLRK